MWSLLDDPYRPTHGPRPDSGQKRELPPLDSSLTISLRPCRFKIRHTCKEVLLFWGKNFPEYECSWAEVSCVEFSWVEVSGPEVLRTGRALSGPRFSGGGGPFLSRSPRVGTVVGVCVQRTTTRLLRLWPLRFQLLRHKQIRCQTYAEHASWIEPAWFEVRCTGCPSLLHIFL